tara:strand:- start:1047 stop:1268 length:222 start_codon:yes stop_codon:yes gene_type:complete
MADIFKMVDGVKVKLTTEDIKVKDKFEELAKQDIANWEKEKEATKQKKASGKAKLKSGDALTDAEISALFGDN